MSTQEPALPDRRHVDVWRSQYTLLPAVSGSRAFCALPRDGTIRTVLSLTNKPSFHKEREMAAVLLLMESSETPFRKPLVLFFVVLCPRA